MAKSVKIEKLDEGLTDDLPQIVPLFPPDLLATMAGSTSKIVLALHAGIVGFANAELTDEDRERLQKINADLLESAGKWDRKRSDLIIAEARKIAKLAAELAADPVKLTAQITEAEADKIGKIEMITLEQTEAEADLNSQKARIENKQANAGIEALRKVLDYSKTGSGSSGRHKIADHSWLVLDLLKRPDERNGQSYNHYGIWFLHGPTRRQWFYGIGAGIGIGKPGIQVDRETWIEAANQKIDHKDANSPTGVQRYYHYCASYAHIEETLDDLTLKANNIVANGNLAGYNAGGVANLYRIVEKADPDDKRKVKTWKELAEQYNFPVSELPEYRTDDPEAEEVEAEKPKPKATKRSTKAAEAKAAAKAKAAA